MHSRVLGVDLGGTNIRIGYITSDLKLHAYERHSTPRTLGDEPLQNLLSFIEDYLERTLKDQQLDAISIGFPSTISKDGRTIYNTPNIEGLNDVPIGAALETTFDTRIFCSRDVNLLLFHDLYEHKITLEGTTIAIYFGTGLGNAILLDGEIYRGKNGVAAELGHIPVLGNKEVCGCGNVGCIETLVGGRYLENMQRKLFPDTLIRELFTHHWPVQELEDYLEMMAIPVASEINILDPDHVILGGGVLQMPNFPYAALIENIRTMARKPLPEANLQFHRTKEDQRNGVLGAGYYALYEMDREGSGQPRSLREVVRQIKQFPRTS